MRRTNRSNPSRQKDTQAFRVRMAARRDSFKRRRAKVHMPTLVGMDVDADRQDD